MSFIAAEGQPSVTPSDPPMTPLLSARDLHRSYPGQQALAGVSLSLQRGDILGLLGRNGAGKSTTLRLLAGVLRPDRGHVQLNGESLHMRHATRARIGFLPERPPLYPELRVDEYLRFAARLRGVPRPRLRQAVDDIIERCGLGARRKRLCGQLSKGYRQRVGIAQAAVHDPDVLLLDEPGNGLDPVQNQDIRALLKELATSRAIVLSSHVLPDIEALCNRVLLLRQGRVVFESRLPLANGERHLLLQTADADSASIGAIDGIASVSVQAPGCFALTLADEATPAAVVRALCRAGIAIHSLCPAGNRLEQLFAETDDNA